MDIQGRDHYPHFQMHPRSQPAAGAWWWGRCNKLRVHRSRSAHQPAGADPVSTFDVQHRQKTLLLRLDMHWEEQPWGRCDWLAMGQRSRDLFHRGRRICILQSVFWPCWLTHRPTQLATSGHLPSLFWGRRVGGNWSLVHTWKPLCRNPLTGTEMGRHAPRVRNVDPRDSRCPCERFTNPL